ncbi:MAG: EAL domain-containing protein [Oscillatoriaceae bacterium SKW80]|nr:EAL domain-containing protein [Oscillatoriaceae bacterium SKYG93]MCX8119717.1 EAL domain-containing protein [Oscillatoriaceae bacterium SKW80]HIK27621.1 EAL domain-containing protein [Oscillatoriaceae cyanobacterium M7585_C2015_266]
MQRKKTPIYLPSLEEVIDRYPLMVTPETPLIEVITLMGQLRNSCPLKGNNSVTNGEELAISSLLMEARASCVLVMESAVTGEAQRILGIITERDVVKLIAGEKWSDCSGKTLRDIPVSEVMNQPVMTLRQSEAEDIFTVLIFLRQHRIRHLPILDKAGKLLGIVTPETIRQAMLQPANILKMRRVAEVMNANVIQAPPNASVMSLAQLMTTHCVSCVVIVEKREEWGSKDHPLSLPVGMVTERDIVQFRALELDLKQLQAKDVMSTPLFCLSPEDSLWIAHQQMQQRYVQRLVVAGSRGELLGIVTQSSLLQVLDPMEMSGVIDALHAAVEQRTRELKQAIAQLESEIAERQRTETRLRLLESAVVNANDAIAIMAPSPTDPSDPIIIYVNEAFSQMTGYSLQDIVGKTPSCLRGPKSDPQQVAKIRQALSQCQPVRAELINYRKDGCEYWVELNTVPVIDAQGVLTHWVSVQRNVTERKRMEQALFEEKQLAEVTLHAIADGVISTDAAGLIKSFNPVAEKLTGWKAEEAKGLPLTQVFVVVNENTGTPIENTVEIALKENRVINVTNHSVLIARDGREFAIDHSAAPIHAPDGRIIGAVLVFRDVTQIRTQARQLSWQARHDALTGLVNRREFEYQLETAIFSAQNQNLEHILLYLDLDRFKIVNDTCGHIAGDEMLRQVTELFKSRIRRTDTLARIGGDEFALLLYQCPRAVGLQIAESILQSIQTFRFVWQDKTFSIGVSIGLVEINSQTPSASTVLTAADAACYAAKNKGRNRVHIYQTGDACLARQRDETQWAVRINQALECDRFRLYCQSIISLKPPHSQHYCEILLRLEENGEIISPMAFIPAAERYHLMHIIDRWVIRTLFKKIHNSPSQIPALQSPQYAINLSGASLNDDQFINFIQEQFSLYHIPPQTICFEIPETVAFANLSKTTALIRSLKGIGCRFAIDNFGSSISSFAHLKNLHVDYLKIDGNLIKNIVNNPLNLAMIEAINKVGHVMGIKTIAEFVENKALMQEIKKIGVDYAQGFAIEKPHPLFYKKK